MTQIEAGDAAFDVAAIAFDKDGTLIDLDAAWGPAALRWVEIASGGEPTLMGDLATGLGLDLDTGRLVTGGIFAVGTVAQLHEKTLAILSSHGLAGEPAATRADQARATSALAGAEPNLVPLGEIGATFQSLSQAGLRLAIVSSDDRSAVDAAITALGVAALVDAVVSGDEDLDPKPAPDALLLAAVRLGVEPGQMLYVGDSWVDAAAGRAAGAAGVILVGDPPDQARHLASVVVPGVDSIRSSRSRKTGEEGLSVSPGR